MERIIPNWSLIYKSLRKAWLRNLFTIFFAIIIFITAFFIGKANAIEPTHKLEPALTPSEAPLTRPEIKLAPATTTTTTVAPRQVRQNVKQTATPKIVAPQRDWVAQCHLWAAQAGVTLTADAIALIDKESDCSPTAQNPRSSACGIAQNIQGCTGTYGYDPVQQLIWMNNYVNGRYGGWSQAWQFWNCIGYCRGIYKTSTWY